MGKHFGPRNDLAKKFTFDSSAHAGKLGVIEVVDGNSDASWAWIAVQGFSPVVPAFPIDDARGSRQDLRNLIAAYKLTAASNDLATALQQRHLLPNERLGAARVLLQFGQSETVLPYLTTWLTSAEFPEKLRGEIAQLLGNQSSEAARTAVVEAMQTAAADRQAETRAGADPTCRRCRRDAQQHAAREDVRLPLARSTRQAAAGTVEAIGRNQIGAREAGQRPSATRNNNSKPRSIALLTAVNAGQGSSEMGAKSFEKRCAICHKLGGEGQLIGPQLDGVGNRPVARIIEDVVDPNRNVDASFRTVLIQTFDGQIISGLPRRGRRRDFGAGQRGRERSPHRQGRHRPAKEFPVVTHAGQLRRASPTRRTGRADSNSSNHNRQNLPRSRRKSFNHGFHG